MWTLNSDLTSVENKVETLNKDLVNVNTRFAYVCVESQTQTIQIKNAYTALRNCIFVMYCNNSGSNIGYIAIHNSAGSISVISDILDVSYSDGVITVTPNMSWAGFTFCSYHPISVSVV